MPAEVIGLVASLTGLTLAGVKIGTIINEIRTTYKDAPDYLDEIIVEVRGVTDAVHGIQRLVGEQPATEGNQRRDPLVPRESILLTVTRTVMTFSKVESVLEGILGRGGFMRRTAFTYRARELKDLVMRLQWEKATLTMLISIIQCEQEQQRRAEMAMLEAKLNQIISSTPKLADKAESLYSHLHRNTPSSETNSIFSTASTVTLSTFGSILGRRFSFDSVLEKSKPYRRTGSSLSEERNTSKSDTESEKTLRNSAVFRNETMCRASELSLYDIPLYAEEIKNGYHYETKLSTGVHSSTLGKAVNETPKRRTKSNPNLRFRPASFRELQSAEILSQIEQAKRSKRINRLLLEDQRRQRNDINVLVVSKDLRERCKFMTDLHREVDSSCQFTEAEREVFKRKMYRMLVWALQKMESGFEGDVRAHRLLEGLFAKFRKVLSLLALTTEDFYDLKIGPTEPMDSDENDIEGDPVTTLDFSEPSHVDLLDDIFSFFSRNAFEKDGARQTKTYTPTDILISRYIKTLKTQKFPIRELHFDPGVLHHRLKFFNPTSVVGNQDKWLHSFEDIPLIVYLVDMRNYVSADEDAIEESLALFKALVDKQWFKRTCFAVIMKNCKDFHSGFNSSNFRTPEYRLQFSGMDSKKASEAIVKTYISQSAESDPPDRNIYTFVDDFKMPAYRFVYVAASDAIIFRAIHHIVYPKKKK